MKKQVSIILLSMINLLYLQAQNFDFKLYHNVEIENKERYQKGNDYQKDFLLFVDLLEKSHPAFVFENSLPFHADSIKQNGFRWAAECKSDKDLKAYLQSIATLLQDGHTSVLPDINKNLIYPLKLFIDDQNIYLQGITKEYESCLGKKIKQINGHSFTDILNSFRSVFSSDNEIHLRNTINDYIQSYSIWQSTPYCLQDSSLHLIFDDQSAISLRPLAANALNMSWLQVQSSTNTIRQKTKQPFVYQLLPDKGICYLQFNACSDRNTVRQQYLMSNTNQLSEEALEKALAQYPQFDTFLSEMFQQIEAQKVKILVVDVRNNSGGNSKLCDILLSWLMPQKEKKSFTSAIRFSYLWELQYPALATDYRKALLAAQQPFELGKLYDMGYLSELTENQKDSSLLKDLNNFFQMNEDENKIFKGKVIFVQNQDTYSSAGMLITEATDNHIGTVIGSKSSYRPCSYGDLLAWELPNTHIKGFVSHKIFSRPGENKCNEISLTPEIYLPATWADAQSGKDICWDYILEHYTQKN